MKGKTFHIKDPVMRIAISIFYGYSEEYAVNIGQNMGIDCEETDADAHTFIADGMCGIWINPKLIGTKREIPVFVHELLHAVMGKLMIKHVPISQENDEIIAYLLEYFTQKVIERISK